MEPAERAGVQGVDTEAHESSHTEEDEVIADLISCYEVTSTNEGISA